MYEHVFIVKISLITWYEKIIGNPAQLQNDQWFSIVNYYFFKSRELQTTKIWMPQLALQTVQKLPALLWMETI